MSVRLNVVIVQASHMSALQSDVTEQVMIDLLGRPGLDLLIVQSLISDPASTDYMALTALESDIVIVDWHSEEAIVSYLGALGIEGYSAAHELNPQPQATASISQRRFYCFDLRMGFKASQVAATILKLLGAKQVRTVSIGNVTPIRSNRLPVTTTNLEPSVSVQLVNAAVSSPVSATAAQHTLPETTNAALDEDQQLDRLVDGLNDADW